jgi:tRNA1Val (adenine37-N6)-methyltransferase
MAFRFQQFSVHDQRSTMRVGTDAMLLGSWASPPACGKVLDIGTGCGVLALMMAQRSEAWIDAVEVDEASCNEAAENFQNTPWKQRLHTIRDNILNFSLNNHDKYHYIISNPPFFTASLKSPDAIKNGAKHDTLLNHRQFFDACRKLLLPDGQIATIIPSTNWMAFYETALNTGFFPCRILEVSPFPGAEPHRILAEWKKAPSEIIEISVLIMTDSGRRYSRAYLELTRDYHYFNS